MISNVVNRKFKGHKDIFGLVVRVISLVAQDAPKICGKLDNKLDSEQPRTTNTVSIWRFHVDVNTLMSQKQDNFLLDFKVSFTAF